MGIFGQFLNSRAHKSDKILCSTCHGEPHGLNPSTMAKDNVQNLSLQGLPNPIGVCDTCHVGRSTSYGKPLH
jgi:cytochrome c peroxidase